MDSDFDADSTYFVELPMVLHLWTWATIPVPRLSLANIARRPRGWRLQDFHERKVLNGGVNRRKTQTAALMDRLKAMPIDKWACSLDRAHKVVRSSLRLDDYILLRDAVLVIVRHDDINWDFKFFTRFLCKRIAKFYHEGPGGTDQEAKATLANLILMLLMAEIH